MNADSTTATRAARRHVDSLLSILATYRPGGSNYAPAHFMRVFDQLCPLLDRRRRIGAKPKLTGKLNG